MWDDDGEGLFLEDWYGILFGAAASWQPGTSDLAQFQESYGPVFHGDASGKIDEAQRALIVLRDIEGLNYQQIAQVLGCSVSSVKLRLFRARRGLKERMESILKAR